MANQYSHVTDVAKVDTMLEYVGIKIFAIFVGRKDTCSLFICPRIKRKKLENSLSSAIVNLLEKKNASSKSRAILG